MTPTPVKPLVPLSALEALDVRVGTITAVVDVPQSTKLVRLVVSFGDHTRSILAGLKRERPDPQALVGRQALFVVNLEPRTMAGERSLSNSRSSGPDGLWHGPKRAPGLRGRRASPFSSLESHDRWTLLASVNVNPYSARSRCAP